MWARCAEWTPDSAMEASDSPWKRDECRACSVALCDRKQTFSAFLLYEDGKFLFYGIFWEFSARGAKLHPPHAAMEHV